MTRFQGNLRADSLQLGDAEISEAELEALDGLTASATELNYNDGVTPGTAAASKTAILGATKNLDEFHTAALYLGAAAGTLVSSTAAELNKFDGAPLAATIAAPGAEGGNVIRVSVQLTDGNGADLAVRGAVDWYLSSDANGDTVTGTAPDGGVAAGTDGQVISYVAGTAGKAISEADGDIDFDITHAAGALTVYLQIILANGLKVPSVAITFA